MMMFPMFPIEYAVVEEEWVRKETIVDMRQADYDENRLERIIKNRENDPHDTGKTTRKWARAEEDARKRIAEAYFSLEQFTGNAEETQEYRSKEVRKTITQVKKELRELRDATTDESVRKVYDNFYRTAHLHIGNKVKRQRTVTLEYEETGPYGCATTNLNAGIIPLIVAAAGAGARRRRKQRGEEKKPEKKKEIKKRNDAELLVRFIIGTAREQEYSIGSIADLLRKTCTGEFFDADMQRLNETEIKYIHREVLPDLPRYVQDITTRITTPVSGDPRKYTTERRNLLNRGLKRLDQLVNKEQVQIKERAYSIFVAYHYYEHPTEPGEPSNPKVGIAGKREKQPPTEEATDIAHLLEGEAHEDGHERGIRTGSTDTSDPRVAEIRGNIEKLYTKTGEGDITYGTIEGPLIGTEAGPLATPSHPEAPPRIAEERYSPTIEPKKTYAPRGITKTLAKIAVAAGALVTGIMVAVGISNYFHRERAPGEENTSSYSVSTPEKQDVNTQQVLEEVKPQARIQYEPQTAPAYDATNPAPWYQIEKAKISADGSSLELTLGADLLAEGNTIRARYKTPEGKVKTLYAVPQAEQTLDVNGTILDVGVGMKNMETKGFTYYSSVAFQ